MAGIPGLDVTELQTPYRDPRFALKSGAGGIPGLDVSEIYDPARTQVARRAPYKPNFSMPGRAGAAPVAAAPLQLTGGPGSALVPRQNFTMGPDIAAFDPNAAPRLAAPALQAAAVNPDIAAASRARTAGIPGSPTFQGPQAPAAAAGSVPPVAAVEATPGRFAAARTALNSAIPSPSIGDGTFGAAGKAAGALARGAARVLPPVAQALEAGQTVRDTLAPDMTGLDIAGRVAEGGARMAGMGAGGAAGAAAGTAILPGVGTAVGGIIGGGLGYLAPDIANKAYNWITDSDNKLASTTAAENRARAEAPVSGQNVAAVPTPSPALTSVAGPPALGKEAQAAIDAARAAAAPQGLPPPAIAAPVPDISAATPVSPTLDASTQLALSAARSDAAGRVDPGVQGGGVAGLSGSFNPERDNAQRTRQMQMTDLDHIARLGGSGRDRAAAIGAISQLAQAPLAGDATASQERIAGLRESGDLARANAANATNRAIHGDANTVAMRGQDIGAMTHTQATKSALDIANLNRASTERVAQMGADARLSAAEARAQQFMHVPGGQEMHDVGGMPQLVKRPDRVFNNQTGQYVDQPQAAAAIHTDPKALAIRANTKLSDDEKRTQLAALGYK